MGRLSLPLATTLVLLLSGCGSGVSEARGSAEPTTSTSPASTSTTVPTTTATMIGSGSSSQTPPSQLPGREPVPVNGGELLQTTDFSVDFDVIELPDHVLFYDEVCVGVPDVAATMPPNEETRSQINAGQLFLARALTYSTEHEASDAFDELNKAYETCNGGLMDDGRWGEIVVSVERLDSSPLAATSRSAAFDLTLTRPSTGIYFQTHLGVVGSTLFLSATTQEGFGQHVADLVANRLAEARTAVLEPTGGPEFLPGFMAPEYWAWPDEGPKFVRDRGAPSADVADWLRSASDDRIDQAASKLCANALHAERHDDPAFLDQAIQDVLTSSEQDLYSASAPTDIFRLLTSVYCPTPSDT